MGTLPKQETFPETDAKNCTKATSITGLSFTVRGNVRGFKVSPALVSASGTTTCGNAGQHQQLHQGCCSPGLQGARALIWAHGETDFEGQRFISRPSFTITTNVSSRYEDNTFLIRCKNSSSAAPRCAQGLSAQLSAKTLELSAIT